MIILPGCVDRVIKAWALVDAADQNSSTTRAAKAKVGQESELSGPVITAAWRRPHPRVEML